jgi:hypothetical protein
MKTPIPVPVNVAGSRMIRQPRTVQYRIASQRSLLRRFQYFIEFSDWDQRYLCNKLIDKICLGIIALSLIYFVPFLAPICMK